MSTAQAFADRIASPADDLAYRRTPHNLEAEQALLGAILVNNAALERVADFLDPQHFYDPVHHQIYEAACKLIHAGKQATPTTLRTFFETADPISPTLTVPQYLGTLASKATTIINAKDYGRTIYDLATRRALIIIGEDMVNAAYDSPVDLPPQKQIEDVHARLDAASGEGADGRRSVTISEAAERSLARANEAYKSGGGIAGLRSGFGTLDRKLGGLMPGHLIIIGGRPAMGKTALATNMAQNMAAAGVHVGFFSLEMEAVDLSDRVLARLSGVRADNMNDGRFTRDEMEAWMEAKRRLDQWPLRIEEAGTMTIQQLASAARRMKRRHGLDVLIVDYLQKLSGVAYRGGKGDGNRVQEITEISGGLKAMAKDLQIPVIALSQLSRQVENREDKRPGLSDLRDSGSIEQDADVIIFPFREAYYLENSEPAINDAGRAEWEQRMEACRNVAEVAIAKHRHRSTGTVRLGFNGPLTSFYDLDEVR